MTADGLQKRRQLGMNAWTDRARRIVFLLQEARRDDDVGVDRPERNAQLGGEPLLGPLGVPQRVLVADDQRWPHLVAEPQEVVVGRLAHDKADAAPGEILGHIAEAFEHEMIMTQIGPGGARDQREVDHHRLAEGVGRRDRRFERRVVGRPLGALHPVHHGRPVVRWLTVAPHAYARVRAQLLYVHAADRSGPAAARRPLEPVVG